jgi:hypothetical protein
VILLIVIPTVASIAPGKTISPSSIRAGALNRYSPEASLLVADSKRIESTLVVGSASSAIE